MNDFDYDLVIVGGGLVGGSLALALAHSSLRVAVVDAQTETERRASPAGLRALALARGSVQILDRLGVVGGEVLINSFGSVHHDKSMSKRANNTSRLVQ